MGNVATLFKVYVEEGKDAIVGKEIKDKLKPTSMQFEDIAFGIKVLKVMFVHDDKEGSSTFEEKIKKIKGVNEVEVAEESLL